MPSPRDHRRVSEEKKDRYGRLSEKSMSFHGHSTGSSKSDQLRRPKTVSDLLSGGRSTSAGESPEVQVRPSRLTKLLLNVTILRSDGPVHVLISLESTVHDLITAAILQYSKEGRRPVLCSTQPLDYDLHYSQFSLESLERTEKLTTLGSRNFFLCPKDSDSVTGFSTSASSRCAKQADSGTKIALTWFKFMDLML